MKSSKALIFVALVLVGCVVLRGKPLTYGQAQAMAIRLANEKFAIEYKIPTAHVFETNTPSNNLFGATRIKAFFLDDRWIFDLSKLTPGAAQYAHVELAADGSTNQASVKKSPHGLP